MTTFPEPPPDTGSVVTLEETDKPLPKILNPGNRYAYFKTIARGGKCIIQSCKDLHLGRVVCYKKLRPEFENDAVEQQRFLREARISAMLQHPNTVPTYELGRTNRGHYYFTMKLVHGYTLREVLDYRERYDFGQLIDVVQQVTNALEYAHACRVVHRDIKPENILIGPFGEVLILDWGLAKVWSETEQAQLDDATAATISTEQVSHLTGQGKLQGTITYMSPEQIRRDPAIDYRSDIYSIGVVLFEVLCGRPPFTGETVNDVREQILQTEPVPPSTYSKFPIPALLDKAAHRCIAKDPEARLLDCQQLRRILNEEW
ncbi:MAG: serine/threonine-protein kinase [Pseudomonadales bacterium]|jgi:serine/threonine-protein kinase|nr:serine/threonine-protein kinase [Pseudomonadales bacterium]